MDYQNTSMPTGAKKRVLDHVRTWRALRGCRQPGERGSRLCRGPPRSCENQTGGGGVGGGLALRAQFSRRGENFTPRSRCQKMAKFWGKTAAGHVKKILNGTVNISLKIKMPRAAHLHVPPAPCHGVTHALQFRWRQSSQAAPRPANSCGRKTSPSFPNSPILTLKTGSIKSKILLDTC